MYQPDLRWYNKISINFLIGTRFPVKKFFTNGKKQELHIIVKPIYFLLSLESIRGYA